MLHPDFAIQIENARHQDLRNAQTTRHLAKLAQGNMPNRLLTIIKWVVMYTKWKKPQSVEGIQVSKLAQTQIGNEQV